MMSCVSLILCGFSSHNDMLRVIWGALMDQIWCSWWPRCKMHSLQLVLKMPKTNSDDWTFMSRMAWTIENFHPTYIPTLPVVSIQKSWWQKSYILMFLFFPWTCCTWTRCMLPQSSPVVEIHKCLGKLPVPAEFQNSNLAMLNRMTCISPLSCPFVSEQ